MTRTQRRVRRRARPTRAQVRVVAAAVEWYLRLYHKTLDDPGVAATFADRAKVGAFAVKAEGLSRGDDEDLFRLLVTTTMFQRRQDLQIMRILRSIGPADARELTSRRRLVLLSERSPCRNLKSATALIEHCDLAKHPTTRAGTCNANPDLPCHLKRHTVLLRRYGHFGKVPTSAALVVREAGAGGLSGLKRRVWTETADPAERARRLESAISRAWRVSDKIAAMFLSALTAPDMSSIAVPWREGVDWTYFVVIDSNVDLFLASVGYCGLKTYDARRSFVREIASQIDLARLKRGLVAFNPRLVQQAMYLFMSAINRKASPRDCSHLGPDSCAACPKDLRSRCPVEVR